MDDNGLSDLKDSENDWDLDINIDEKDNENNKINKNSLNNNKKLNSENEKQKDIKKDLNNNAKNKYDINNIYETYDKDFTIIDSKISSINYKKKNFKNTLNNKEDKEENKNKDKNKINNLNKINVEDYNFQNIKNNNILSDYSNNKQNKNIIKNIIENNNDDNVVEDIDISRTFKKVLDKKENNNIIFDFENIELPKESQNGDFTEIKCPFIIENKKEEDEKKEENNNQKILKTFYNFNIEDNILKKSINNNYLNYFKVSDPNLLSDKLYKTCINFRNKKKEIDIIKIMAVLKSSNNQTWKDNLKSLVSSLYYNGYGLTKSFNKDELVFPLFIFDMKFDYDIKDEINILLKSYLYMSYRSGFINLSCIGCGDYSSDCGWGCMIRCCQMILSKGLIQKKLFDFFQKNNSLIIYEKSLESIRKQVLALFNDNYLPAEEVKNNPYYKYFWEKYSKLTKTNPEYNSISEIIPPYSIHILSKLGKCSGVYTSDIKIIKLIIQISSQIFNDLNIVLFENGYISRKKLITYFCEEYTDFNSNYLDTITYNGVDYIFKKGGIVFISLRLGLYDLDPSFYDIIPLLFKKFHNNIGFVSGKKNRAYYFIGIQGKDNKLIFADPHYNQQISNNSERDYSSYYTDNLYLLDIKDLSSELTLGITIFNSIQLTEFLDDLKWFNDNLNENIIITLGKD